jgi:hypothetical protein
MAMSKAVLIECLSDLAIAIAKLRKNNPRAKRAIALGDAKFTQMSIQLAMLELTAHWKKTLRKPPIPSINLEVLDGEPSARVSVAKKKKA